MTTRPDVVLRPDTSRRWLLLYFAVFAVLVLLAGPARGEDGAGAGGLPVPSYSSAPAPSPSFPDVPGWIVSMGPTGIVVWLAYRAGQGVKVRVTVDLSDDDRALLRGLVREPNIP